MEVATQGCVLIFLPRSYRLFLPRVAKHSSPRALIFCIILGALLLTASAFATATDEITRAVSVGGAPVVSSAPPEVFIRGLTAVSLRVDQSDLPHYAMCAIQLRQDLTPEIVTTTLRSSVRSQRGVIAPVVGRIITAAVWANPREAVAITLAALEIDPALRGVIVAAAIAAAPEQREAIESAATTYAAARFTLRRNSSFAGQMSAMNLANSSNPGDGDKDDIHGVQSPERPPNNPPPQRR